VLEALEGAVLGRIVRDSVLPAAPDDVGPGAGENAFGVGVALAVGAELLVAVASPFVAVGRVAGKVADGVSEFLVGGPPECDGSMFAGGAGGRGDSGERGKGFGFGEPGAAVADLGEKGRSADGVGSGKGSEDVAVGVGVQQFSYPSVESLYLAVEGFEERHERQGDAAAGFAFVAQQPGWCLGEVTVEIGGGAATSIALVAEPGAETLLR
jgi:hypothetical protein